MKRFSLDEVEDIYDETGYKPVTLHYLDTKECEACAVGAMYLLHIDRNPGSTPGFIKLHNELEAYGFERDYLAGVDTGFSTGYQPIDGENPAKYPDTAEFRIGCEDGFALRERMLYREDE